MSQSWWKIAQRFGIGIAASVFMCSFANATAAPDSVSIPFRYIHYGIFVRVHIGAKGPYAFLIDTDTTPSAIDLGLAKQLNLRMGKPGSGSGIGSGKITVYPVTIPQVIIGKEPPRDVKALVLDFSRLSTYVGTHIDGVLGTSFLNGHILQIDYPCHTVSFLKEPMPGPYTTKFRWDTDGGNVFDGVRVGSAPVTATFDSGNGGYSYITAGGISKLHLEAAVRSGRIEVARGYRGKEKAIAGKISDVRLGSVTLGSLQTRFLPNQHSSFDINIGNRALDQFVVTMDYERGLLTLSKSRPCSSR